MGESLTQPRSVRDEGLRVLNLFQYGKKVPLLYRFAFTVPAKDAQSHAVTAAAMIRTVRALICLVGRKGLAGGKSSEE